MASLTMYVSDTFYDLIARALRGNRRYQSIRRAETLSACCPRAAAARSDMLILELMERTQSRTQDLMEQMERDGYRPALLLFERDRDGQVSYTLSAEDAVPLSAPLEALFTAALAADYRCRRRFFRLAPFRTSTEMQLVSEARDWALTELMYGASREESAFYRSHFRLDLRENGYYAYYWELNYTIFADHFCYKDVYNFIGFSLKEACRRVLEKYSGGEVFYVSLTMLCVLVNSFGLASESQDQRRLSAVLAELGAITGSDRATRYVSRRFRSVGEFRGVYDTYLTERATAFFGGRNQLINAAAVEKNRVEADPAEINRALDEITKYLNYDVNSIELDRTLRRLFLEVLKNACDAPMYSYTASVLSSKLMQADPRLSKEEISPHLDSSYLSHSSIEEEYAFFCSAVENVRRQSGGGKQSKNTLMMKTMDFIRNNYRENIRVSDIAGALYVSETYLSRISRTLTGKSVIQNLVEYRISQAKIALEEEDIAVYAIAEQCGFRDVRHFSKTFKKMTGQSPKEYRRSHF